MPTRFHTLAVLLSAAVVALVAMSAVAQAALPVTVAKNGTAAGQVDVPRGTAVDQASGDMYVADAEGNRVDKFDAEGHFLLAWGAGVADGVSEALQTCGPQAFPPTVKCYRGLSEGKHNSGTIGVPGAVQPTSIAVEQSSGDVYVTDKARLRVTKFGPNGEFLLMFGKNVDLGPNHPGNLCTAADIGEGDACGGGETGAGAGEFFGSLPSAVIVVGEAVERVWVKDETRVDQFDAEGHFLSQATIPLSGTAGLAHVPGGDFYTIKTGVRGERQKVTFSGFKTGDRFSIASLPAGCTSSSTGPIVYSEGKEGREEGREAITQAMQAACGVTNVSVSGDVPAVEIAFKGILAYSNAGQIACSRESGSGSCLGSTIADGAPGTVYKLVPSGNPVSALAVGEALYTGGPEALTLTQSGDLVIGDALAPYHFVLLDATGKQISRFGAGHVIVDERIGPGPQGDALATGQSGGREVLYVASSQSSGGESQPGPDSVVQRFPLPGEGPLPETGRAKELASRSAVLEATVNPEGRATTYFFEYGTSTTYGTATPARTLPGSAFNDEAVSEPLAGLVPGGEYHFRVVASNHCDEAEPARVCTVYGEDETFTTPTTVGVDGQWADEVTAGSAKLDGQIDPRGLPADWWVEYGSSEAYGSITASGSLLAGSGDVSVSRSLSGLLPGTLYHYRFVAEDELEGVKYRVYGTDRTFTTGINGVGFVLVDDRAWEQVTPLVKGAGKIVGPWLGTTQAAEDGSAITYATAGPTGGGEGNRTLDPLQSLARRQAGGWSSGEINPPEETTSPVQISSEFRLFNSDLSLAAVEPRGMRAKDPSSLSDESSERSPYLREDFASPVRWRPLVTSKEPFADVPPGTEFGGEAEEQLHNPLLQVRVMGASPDLHHVVLSSSVPLGSEAEGAKHALYEWTNGTLGPISRLPSGKTVEGVLGSQGTIGRGSIRGAVSGDGRYVYWSNSENKPSALYLRDTVAAKTVRLDVPAAGVSGGNAEPVFQGASVSGRRVLFTDTQRLTQDAGELGADLYECEVKEGAGGPECPLHDLTPETASGEAAQVQGMVSSIDTTADSVYFVANGALAAGAEPGDCTRQPTPGAVCNLYHAKLNPESGAWTVGFVALLSNGDWPDWAGGLGGLGGGDEGTGLVLASGSPDGRYLVFMSERSLTGYDNADAASGEADEEVFRYDAQREALTCVSCDPSGARPHGAEVSLEAFKLPVDWHQTWGGRWLAGSLPDPSWWDGAADLPTYQPRSVLDDGRVLFNSYSPLVSGDSNGTSDVYEYEPWGSGTCGASSAGAAIAQAAGEGCVALLSSGTSDSESALLDSSASGGDVFILSAAKLSVLDEDSDYDIYDVREHGVAAEREQSSQCQGEACQPPYSPLIDPTPASAVFEGVGNVTIAGAGSKPVTVKKKSLSRAQKLAGALKACHKKPKRKRASCERQARRAYSATPKAKKASTRHGGRR